MTLLSPNNPFDSLRKACIQMWVLVSWQIKIPNNRNFALHMIFFPRELDKKRFRKKLPSCGRQSSFSYEMGRLMGYQECVSDVWNSSGGLWLGQWQQHMNPLGRVQAWIPQKRGKSYEFNAAERWDCSMETTERIEIIFRWFRGYLGDQVLIDLNFGTSIYREDSDSVAHLD